MFDSKQSRNEFNEISKYNRLCPIDIFLAYNSQVFGLVKLATNAHTASKTIKLQFCKNCSKVFTETLSYK